MPHKKLPLVIVLIFLTGLMALEIALDLTDFAPTFSYQEQNYALDEDHLFRSVPEKNLDALPTTANPRLLILGDEKARLFQRDIANHFGLPFDAIDLTTPGYGPDQWLMRMQTEAHTAKADGIILFINLDNDFSELSRNQIFYVRSNSTVSQARVNFVQRIVPPLKILVFLRHLFTGSYFSTKDFEALTSGLFADPATELQKDSRSLTDTMLMHHVLARFQHLAAEQNRPLIVIALGSQRESFNKKIVETLCQNYGIPFLSGIASPSTLEPFSKNISAFLKIQIRPKSLN